MLASPRRARLPEKGPITSRPAGSRRGEMSMVPINIMSATDAEAEAVCAHLRTFNHESVGAFSFTPVWLAAHDASGALVGGFVGEVYLDWLSIDVLWVAESKRRRGIGDALLSRAESEAIALGAKAAYLDTFEWQAQAFYEGRGYCEFGRLDDFPQGHCRVFMKKRLAPKE
jgi:GNAT superfamily N-acetyltransferase